MVRKIEFIRNSNAGDLLEILFVSAVSCIFVIRFYLHLTGYPQIGGRFHVAHMIWGGFFMLGGLVFLLSFLGSKNRTIAAILGGIGFGFFIDELGKFITRDNNYFYQPTVAILYLIFLILFFIFRYIEHARKPTHKEYLMNALELLQEAVLNDMDTEEKKVFDSYIRHSSSKYHYLAPELKRISETLVTKAPPEPGKARKFYRFLKKDANRFIQSQLFQKIIVLFFIWNSVLAMIRVLVSLSATEYSVRLLLHSLSGLYTFTAQGQLISTSIAIFLAILGIFTLRLSRLKAYVFFRYSILVNIFVTQFFAFYQNQFNALLSLSVNVILLLGINYVIAQEKELKNETLSES